MPLMRRAKGESIVMSKPVHEQLSFLNWQKGHTLEEYGEEYFYDKSAGTGVPVYLIDKGVNLDLVSSFSYVSLPDFRLTFA